MAHKVFECDYCDFRSENIEKVNKHEKEHIQEIQVVQIRSDGEEIASMLSFSVQKNGYLHLSFATETPDSSRTYRYIVSAEGYEKLRNIQREGEDIENKDEAQDSPGSGSPDMAGQVQI